MKAILVISGFTEKLHGDTGSRKLWSNMQRSYANGTNVVLLREWNSNHKKTAQWLDAMGVTECLICAYSWGAGYGLKKFAKHFPGQISAVLCDPVFHSPFFLTRWMALTHDRTIKYPNNVEVRQWFNQKLDEPGGDKVKAVDMPLKPTTLPYPHSQIDDSPEYHKAAKAEARFFFA